MKIKATTTSRVIPTSSGIFGERKRVRFLVFGIGTVAVVIILFFSILGYGAYLKKIGKTTYLRNAMDQMIALDFSFFENYVHGTQAEFDQLNIDIKFKHLLRFQYLRDQSLKDGYIDEAFKNEEFPARMTYKNQTRNIKLGMTGKEAMTHLRNPSKWSLQINVKGNQTIRDMKRFSLLMPNSRGFLTDWLGITLLKERGLIGLRTDFVEVAINGRSSGIYYMEERFDKHLIEHNRLREGIIFKLEEHLRPYREAKLLLQPDTREQLLLIQHMWQDVMTGELPPEHFFDLKKLASLFVVTDLMNNKHPLIRENLRFYFNPVTGLAEPIAREFENLDETNPDNLSMFLETPHIGSRHLWLTKDPILRIIYNSPEFQRLYLQEAAIICQEEFLDNLFAKNEEKISVLLKKLYRTWPFYDLPTQKLYQHQKYMRSVLFPKEDQIAANWIQKRGDYLGIQLQNQQSLPVEISHVSWQDSILFPLETPDRTEPQGTISHQEKKLFYFHIPNGFSFSTKLIPNFKVHYNLLGLEPGEKSVWVVPPTAEEPMPYISALNAEEKKTFIETKEDKTLDYSN